MARPNPRVLESEAVVGSFVFEVSVEYGHRTEAENLDDFQSFSNEYESTAE